MNKCETPKKRDRREYFRLWHQKNKERRYAALKKSRLDNPERARAYCKKYREANPEKSKISQKKWRDKNKAYNAIRMGKYRVKRRSLERAALVNLNQINRWVKTVRSRESNFCYYCRIQVATESLHFDHIVPISKGGQHSVENLCVSCKKCNQLKSATLLRDWRHHSQMFLSL